MKQVSKALNERITRDWGLVFLPTEYFQVRGQAFLNLREYTSLL